MPVNESPFQELINEMVQEFMNVSNSKKDWSPIPIVSHEHFEVIQSAKSSCSFKIIGKLPGSAADAFSLFHDVSRRPEWDENCNSVEVLEVINDKIRILHLKLKPVWPASARDAILLNGEMEFPDGRLLSVARSIEYNSDSENGTGYVRMTVQLAGQVLIPSKGGNYVDIIQIADGDLKGWIPKSVINIVATKMIPNSFLKLYKILSIKAEKALTRAFEKEDVYVEEGEEEIEEEEEEETDLERVFSQLNLISDRLDRIEAILYQTREQKISTLSTGAGWTFLAGSAFSFLAIVSYKFAKKIYLEKTQKFS